jgi:hypothetical protein
MRLLLILLSATLLAACGTAPVVPSAPVIAQEKQSTNVDPELIKACSPLKPLDSTIVYTQEQQTKAINGWAAQYDDCSKRFFQFVTIVTPVL